MRHKPLPTTSEYVEGVLAGNRAMLGRAITLVESEAPHHQTLAQDVLRQLLPHTGRSLRLGITGVPGVGKSSLIEVFGMRQITHGRRVAVLAVDPSSTQSQGSILGDKTRMEQLSQSSQAFIRPAPTGGMLGGVARRTRESMLVLEAAGYDLLIVETVGVGQSEIAVRSMTDCFILLALAGAGDELQAIKKGVVELADIIALTKADGTNREAAVVAAAEYRRALRYLGQTGRIWQPQVLTCSAQTGEGIEELWQTIHAFHQAGLQAGWFALNRQEQNREWLHTLIRSELEQRFYRHPAVMQHQKHIEEAVVAGTITALEGAQRLLKEMGN